MRAERCAACGRPTYVGEDFGGPCPHDTDLACALWQLDTARGERHEAQCECDAAVKAADKLTRERDEAREELARFRLRLPTGTYTCNLAYEQEIQALRDALAAKGCK